MFVVTTMDWLNYHGFLRQIIHLLELISRIFQTVTIATGFVTRDESVEPGSQNLDDLEIQVLCSNVRIPEFTIICLFNEKNPGCYFNFSFCEAAL